MKFLLENYNPILLALIIGSGAVLVWPVIARLFSKGRDIGTLEATRLMNGNALVLDVRDAAEFASGHLPNAKHIPLGELDKRVSELSKFKEKPIIVSCKTGTLANHAIGVLIKNEFTQVYQLRGGIAAWQNASLPLDH